MNRIDQLLQQMIAETSQQVLPTVYSATMLAGLQELQGLTTGIEAQRDFAQQPAAAVPERDELDARLAAAGMLTVANLMQGQPIDAFIKHAGVCDLDTFSEWLDLKCREFLSLKARRELEKQEDDELYEWVLSHAAVFHEVRVNFKAALAAPAAPVAQEPVAWALIDRGGLVRLLHKTEEASRSAEARWAESYSGCSHVPLYTAPPAAEQPDTVKVPRDVLRACRESLAGGLETAGSAEAEWSTKDRALVARIDALLAGGAE